MEESRTIFKLLASQLTQSVSVLSFHLRTGPHIRAVFPFRAHPPHPHPLLGTGTYEGMTLLSTLGETFCEILNGKVGKMPESKILSEWQGGFRPNHSLVDHVYNLDVIMQGRKDAGRTTCRFFLDAREANGTIWSN